MKYSGRGIVQFLALSILVLPLAAAAAPSKGGAKPTYTSYLTGSSADVTRTTTAGEVLMGGGTDVDQAFVWMINKSGGGDFVVLGTSGKGEYNSYIARLGKVDSVETLITSTSTTAGDLAVVADKIRKAEALFIKGGDQTTYAVQWKGTPVEDAINYLANVKHAPIGGTSAGLAILSQFYFRAANGSAYSADVLADPYNAEMDLDRDFLAIPDMQGIITDSHFVTRDRMGRSIAFLARIVQNGWAVAGKGIGVDEQTAVLVEPGGQATVAGVGKAYFLGISGQPEVCVAQTPLIYQNVPVYRLGPQAGNFSLATWTGTGGTAYTLSAAAGALTSTQPGGAIY